MESTVTVNHLPLAVVGSSPTLPTNFKRMQTLVDVDVPSMDQRSSGAHVESLDVKTGECNLLLRCGWMAASKHRYLWCTPNED